jgi:SAM-dependent methyltransferase
MLAAIGAIAPDERAIFDLTGTPDAAAAIRARLPSATVDADDAVSHDVAVVAPAEGTAARAALLARALAGLKPGGRLLLHLPNRRSLRAIAALANGRPLSESARLPTLAEVRAELLFTGFVDVRATAVHGEPLPDVAPFPARAAAGNVTVAANGPDELRALAAEAFVIEARTPGP